MKINFSRRDEKGEVDVSLETQTPEEWAVLSKSLSEVLQYLTTTMMMEMKVEHN